MCVSYKFWNYVNAYAKVESYNMEAHFTLCGNNHPALIHMVSYFRVLPRKTLRWAWPGLGLWPHQRKIYIEGMGGRYAERAWEEHHTFVNHIHSLGTGGVTIFTVFCLLHSAQYWYPKCRPTPCLSLHCPWAQFCEAMIHTCTLPVLLSCLITQIMHDAPPGLCVTILLYQKHACNDRKSDSKHKTRNYLVL